MDWLTFLSSIFDSLAWPIVVLLAVLMLRRPLSNLIPFLRKLKWKDFEAEFGREVSMLGDSIRREIQVPAPSPSGVEDPLGILSTAVAEYSRLAELSPRSVVLESWRQVESAARNIASQHDMPAEKIESLPPAALGRFLAQAGIIDNKQLDFFNHLRGLRNKAAHAEEFAFSKEDALEYTDVSKMLAEYILRVGS